MKNLFRAIAIVSMLSLSLTACGGAMGDDQSGEDDLSKSFDPVIAYPQVKAAAAKYAKNPLAVSLKGSRNSTASTSSSYCSSFGWVWTLMGEDGIFVDVQVNSQSVKVLKHEKRFLFAGQATFDGANVMVNGQDVLALAASLTTSQPTEMDLVSALVQQATGPRWAITFPKGGYITIDGVTGATIK